MIVLFTDFGLQGPYIGQVKAVLYQQAPAHPVVDLCADAPAFDPRCSAYLLAAYVTAFPVGSVFCAVVDPGVGSRRRDPVVVEAGGRWYVGPDNGLFCRVAAADPAARCWRIDWRPAELSATFHGRDLFAPVAARLANGEKPPGVTYPQALSLTADWPADYPAVIYVDHFGNALTGIRATSMVDDDVLGVSGEALTFARTFDDVAVGQGFWYRNANGLVEIALNQGHAAGRFGLSPGTPVTPLRQGKALI
jgi:S-adenosylmethionine hydrolase